MILKQDKYPAAIYCRLSSDDGQEGESCSIHTQRTLLRQFCEDNRFSIHDYYVDDGYSGKSFDRPDFQRMLKDGEAGKGNLGNHSFAGLLYCADRGSALNYHGRHVRSGRTTKNGDLCRWIHKQYGKEQCSNHYISYDELYRISYRFAGIIDEEQAEMLQAADN